MPSPRPFRVERWVTEAKDSPRSDEEVHEDYLSQNSTFPEDTPVHGGDQPATILERTGPDEWLVDVHEPDGNGRDDWDAWLELAPRPRPVTDMPDDPLYALGPLPADLDLLLKKISYFHGVILGDCSEFDDESKAGFRPGLDLILEDVQTDYSEAVENLEHAVEFVFAVPADLPQRHPRLGHVIHAATEIKDVRVGARATVVARLAGLVKLARSLDIDDAEFLQLLDQAITSPDDQPSAPVIPLDRGRPPKEGRDVDPP